MRHNLPLGNMALPELLIHRELELLRAAGQRTSRRHRAYRWAKLQKAWWLAVRSPLATPTGALGGGTG